MSTELAVAHACAGMICDVMMMMMVVGAVAQGLVLLYFNAAMGSD